VIEGTRRPVREIAASDRPESLRAQMGRIEAWLVRRDTTPRRRLGVHFDCVDLGGERARSIAETSARSAGASTVRPPPSRR
jgi:hypothetical protein